MTILCAIEDIKNRHHELFNKIIVNPPEKVDEREEFIKQADNLIKDIEFCSSEIKTVDDYTWLSSAAVQWQTIFSSNLNIPKNITLAPAPQAINFTEQKTIAGDADVSIWIRDTAHYFSIIRRAQVLLQEVGDILQKAEEITDDNKERISDDWYRATVYFASEVIEGRIDLVHQLSPDTYHRLESVWLKEVKEIKAYFIWRRTKGTAEDNYYKACENIRDRLLDCHKGSIDEFQHIKNYINDRYLTNDVVNSDLNPAAKNLIKTKAKRIWETTGGINSDKINWEGAEIYVKFFYENIIPAVTEKSLSNALNVFKAFSFSKAPENRYLIINSFEAAIAINFIDPDIIQKIIDDKLLTWNMIL